MLEQGAIKSFLPLCESRGIGIVTGGPYNSGILATGAIPGAFYNYDPASEFILKKVSEIEAICRDYNTPLKAAALQFPLLHPTHVSVIPGGQTILEMKSNFEEDYDRSNPATKDFANYNFIENYIKQENHKIRIS